MKMLIRQLRDAAAARRARQKPDLQQIRLIDVLQRDGLLTDGRSQRLKAHWAAAVSSRGIRREAISTVTPSRPAAEGGRPAVLP